jgi:hypothetical protein
VQASSSCTLPYVDRHRQCEGAPRRGLHRIDLTAQRFLRWARGQCARVGSRHRHVLLSTVSGCQHNSLRREPCVLGNTFVPSCPSADHVLSLDVSDCMCLHMAVSGCLAVSACICLYLLVFLPSCLSSVCLCLSLSRSLHVCLFAKAQALIPPTSPQERHSVPQRGRAANAEPQSGPHHTPRGMSMITKQIGRNNNNKTEKKKKKVKKVVKETYATSSVCL